jgi:hypothetical protein
MSRNPDIGSLTADLEPRKTGRIINTHSLSSLGFESR